jgi:hypothetical protein
MRLENLFASRIRRSGPCVVLADEVGRERAVVVCVRLCADAEPVELAENVAPTGREVAFEGGKQVSAPIDVVV